MSNNQKEEIYDNQIQPLIEQIAAIVKEHDITFFAAADVGRDDFDRPIIASTVLLFEGCHPAFWNVKAVMFDGYRVVAPPMEEDLPSDEFLTEMPTVLPESDIDGVI
jgi:hypothetical protein